MEKIVCAQRDILKMEMKYVLLVTTHVKHVIQLKIIARVVAALPKERKKGIVVFVKMDFSMMEKIKNVKNVTPHVRHAAIFLLVKLVVFPTLVLGANSAKNVYIHVPHVLELKIIVTVVTAMLIE